MQTRWKQRYSKERSDAKRLLLMAQLADNVYYSPNSETNHKALTGYQTFDIANEAQTELCRLFVSDTEMICSFRGTLKHIKENRSRNMDAGYKLRNRVKQPHMLPTPFESQSLSHPGFTKALFVEKPNYSKALERIDYEALPDRCLAQQIINQIDAIDPNHERTLSFTGHSAGGALATLMAGYVAKHRTDIHCAEINTFGICRFANEAFHEALAKRITEYRRCELLNDPASPWPGDEKGFYVHGGEQYVYKMSGEQIRNCKQRQHPHDTYSFRLPGIILHYLGDQKFTAKLQDPHRPSSYIEALNRQVHGIKGETPFTLLKPKEKHDINKVAQKTHLWTRKAYARIRQQFNDDQTLAPDAVKDIQEKLKQFRAIIDDYHRETDKNRWLGKLIKELPELYPALEEHQFVDERTMNAFRTQLIEFATYMNIARERELTLADKEEKKGLLGRFGK